MKVPTNTFIRFCITSLGGGVIDIVSYFILSMYLSVHYFLAGMIAFILAASFNFFIARRWVFSKNSKKWTSQIWVYFLVATVGFFLHQTVLVCGMEWFDKTTEIGIKVLASWIAIAWSYLANKKITFA